MSFLGPKPQTSTSENVNNSLITNTYGGQMQAGTGATNFLAQLLGVPTGAAPATAPTAVPVAAPRSSLTTYAAGSGAGLGGGRIVAPLSRTQPAAAPTPVPAGAPQGNAVDAYQNYLQLAGYAPAMRELSRGITGQGAASGLLRSGATAGRLQTRGAELNNQYFNNFMQQLAGLSGLGLQAGGLVANTGQKSSGSGGSPSTLGSIASTVGGIASIFSDRRLKRDIVKIGEYADGLGKYLYRYMWDIFGPLREGVMADEVATIRPWALGPRRFGFATVNYGAL